MNDHELLEECLEAFRAIVTAATAKKFMKSRGYVSVPYAGAAPYRLAKLMAKQIHDHLTNNKE